MNIKKLFFLLIGIAIFACSKNDVKNQNPSNANKTCIKSNNSDEHDTYFVACEKMPSPIGGIKAIAEKVNYPESARKNNITGRVLIKAFINEKGIVDKVEIIKGLSEDCDSAAMAAIKKTKFIPATQRGKKIKAQVTVPIFFSLK